MPPQRIAYVGDHPTNDIAPARSAGMTAIHIRRGPWGFLHADSDEARRAHAQIDSLVELPAALAKVEN